jgi:hypothetical protein
MNARSLPMVIYSDVSDEVLSLLFPWRIRNQTIGGSTEDKKESHVRAFTHL